MHELVFPFSGFAVLVTIGIMAICVYIAITTTEQEIRQAPRRARLAWRIGWGTIILSVAFAVALVAWAIGRTVMGGWK